MHGEMKGQLRIVRCLGDSDVELIGTAYVERHHLTMRQQIRRLTRKTLAFSKCLRNLRAAVALYVAHYKFCRWHGSVRMTPTMALGVAEACWPVDELLP